MYSGYLDRACGALVGMAIGDALGMPSQTLSRAEIVRQYEKISDYVPPFPDHPVSHGLKAAQITDDTEQALLLAERLVVDCGEINESLWAKDLLDWEADVRERGLRDLLGPSSKAAIEAILAGVPADETGRNGTTNGAAMRIAPVGIATRPEPIPQFVDRIEMASRMTHNTGEAIAAASAVAMVISIGIDGGTFDASIAFALSAAREGQSRGFSVGKPDMADRIECALDLVSSGASERELAEKIGTSVASYESVAAAFAVVQLAKCNPWEAALIAANIGDDTDTIGAIAGAMAGACIGYSSFDAKAIDPVREANDLPIEETARKLLALRAARTDGATMGVA